MARRIIPFKDAILSTTKDFVRISAKPAKSRLSVTTSKFGGIPYLLDPSKYPTVESGEKMIFLAQINFKEVPKIEGFPESGLLQFFINREQFKSSLIYFEDSMLNEGNAVKEYDWLQITGDSPFKFDLSHNNDNSSFRKEFSLSFELDSAPISPVDFQVEKKLHLGQGFNDFDKNISQWYWEYSKPTGHKLGGYPYFSQYDPRDDGSEYTTLLFQMDSQHSENSIEYTIMWGDMGVANFFIKPDDLKNLNFKDVLFHEDSN